MIARRKSGAVNKAAAGPAVSLNQECQMLPSLQLTWHLWGGTWKIHFLLKRAISCQLPCSLEGGQAHHPAPLPSNSLLASEVLGRAVPPQAVGEAHPLVLRSRPGERGGSSQKWARGLALFSHFRGGKEKNHLTFLVFQPRVIPGSWGIF